jgi:phosphoesterase RecJ-like protein
MGSFSKLKDVLEEKESFVLVCHIDPDGDAIGSLCAMGEVLEANQKRATLVSKDNIPEIFDFIDGVCKISSEWPSKYDAIILLDNGDFRRTGFQKEILEAKQSGIPIINIDHHPKNDIWRISNINMANIEASSTSEIIFELLERLSWKITPTVATSLLAGIFYDTGGFQHQNTSKRVLDITGELLRRGGKLKKISERLISSRSISLFKLWGIALNRLNIHPNYKISISFLTRADLAETGSKEEEISGLVNLLNTAVESRGALLLYESQDGKIKGSLRTEKEDVDMSKLATILGGGGHKKAAGFSFNGKIVKNKKGCEIA